MHKSGDIVLTPFPFTDLSGNKVRPALILGVQSDGDDITVCFISSVAQKYSHKFEVLVDPKDKDFKKTGLKLKSIIKTVKIATLDKAVVLGKIGEMDATNMKKVKKVLKTYFEL
ncbi:MAG TPA: type II toxin-antitoxin system PemK/MazF family toxin [Candidatus Paceibacterota bacterium]|jgi:mRNA interferase MazF|nr:type II toxin-antitoxin system PemK/MazF family toxin [Candidatus Paceibacterota bacterium]